MIARITGKLLNVSGDFAFVSVGPFEYEVWVPGFTRRQLQHQIGQEVSLHTLDYLEGNAMQGRLVPRLIGFISGAEKEFFELFCSVDGVGVKKALRAMERPVNEVADAIEEQNKDYLSSLPGVGQALAERIIAKLRRKVSRFALLVSRDAPEVSPAEKDVIQQTYEALRTLGHSESESRHRIETALSGKKKYATVEAMIQAIYEHSKLG